MKGVLTNTLRLHPVGLMVTVRCEMRSNDGSRTTDEAARAGQGRAGVRDTAAAAFWRLVLDVSGHGEFYFAVCGGRTRGRILMVFRIQVGLHQCL